MSVNYNTGIQEYVSYGTGGSAGTYAGRVTGGEMFGDAGIVWRPSVSGKVARGNGMWRGGGRATIEVADHTLINYFKRSTWTDPTVTALTIEAGTLTAGEAFTQTGCRINELELAFAVGEALTATIGWLATDQDPQASPSAQAASTTHFEWFQGQCVLNSSTRHLQRLTITASNGLDPISSIETKAAGSMRIPEDYKVGYERVTFSATMLEYPGTSIWQVYDDTPSSTITLSAIAVNASGTFTAAVTVGSISSVRLPFEGEDGAVMWDISGECTPNDSSALTLSYS